jgi:flagellar operon protein
MVNRITCPPLIAGAHPASRTAPPPPSKPFASVLQGELKKAGGVRFSAHAQSRLESRQINLSAEELSQIDQAVAQAAAKGARESLLLLDRIALVVNVPNRTVITALTTSEAENNVFTNIDSAIVVPGRSVRPLPTNNSKPAPIWGGFNAAE